MSVFTVQFGLLLMGMIGKYLKRTINISIGKKCTEMFSEEIFLHFLQHLTCHIDLLIGHLENYYVSGMT